MFDTFENRIIVNAELKTITAIHIGATNTGFMPSMVKKPIIKDALGKPFIPGSSIKGIFRSFAEALFSTEIGLKHLNKNNDENYKKPCNFNKMCLDTKENKDELKKLKEEQNDSKHEKIAQYVFNNICVICRVFGSAESSGKLLFSDAKLINDCVAEVRTGNAIDRDLNVTLKNHVFDYEVIPKDTSFVFKLILENTNNEERQIIKTLLYAAENEMMHIGGNITRGLGSFCLENIEVGKFCIDNIFKKEDLFNLVPYTDFEWGEN